MGKQAVSSPILTNTLTTVVLRLLTRPSQGFCMFVDIHASLCIDTFVKAFMTHVSSPRVRYVHS